MKEITFLCNYKLTHIELAGPLARKAENPILQLFFFFYLFTYLNNTFISACYGTSHCMKPQQIK